jgi:hypothetical protein
MSEIRRSLRALANSPVFTITVILTLTLGVGMNTAVFSMVNAVMLRPLPYHQPDRLISLWEEHEGARPNNFSSSGGSLGVNVKKAGRTNGFGGESDGLSKRRRRL